MFDSQPVHDARAKATGASLYTADLDVPGCLRAKLLLSKVAHGVVESMDLSEAEKVPGVRLILTCFNTPELRFNSAKRYDGHQVVADEQVFSRTLRYKGQPAAAVVADTEEAAQRAVRLIRLDIRELPAVLSIESALEEDGAKANEEAPLSGADRNAMARIEVSSGDAEGVLASAALVFEDVRLTHPVHHLALEPHAVVADYRERRKLVVHSSTQNTFGVRLLLSEILDLPRHLIRVVKPTMGGAFGSKIPMILEPIAAIASMRLGRPVRLELTRAETFLCTRTRHGSKVQLRTAVSPDGRLLAQDVRYWLNGGAYCTQSPNVAAAAAHKSTKLYRVGDFRIRAVPLYTNLPVAGAMRGYGSPQLAFALQTHLFRISRELGIDFLELQRKNLVLPDSREAVHGSAIGNPRVLDCLERGAELFGWEAKKREVADRRARVQAGEPLPLRGIGIGVGMHGNGVYGVHVDFTGIRIKVNEDDTVVFATGTHDMGNGSVTVQKTIIASELRTTVDRIEAIESDTETCPWNLGDFASRGVFVSAAAARASALAMRELLLGAARDFFASRGHAGGTDAALELTETEVRSADGALSVPRLELLRYIYLEKQFCPEITESRANAADRTSYGVHFALVEIDRTTGRVGIPEYAAVHDSGTVLNRLGIEGQLAGGIQMSTGYALCEKMEFDSTGTLLNGHLGRYRTIGADRMPKKLVMDFIEEGDEPGPYGAKSIGECAVVPGAPAIVNALSDALGVYPEEIPVTEEYIVRALKERGLHIPARNEEGAAT